MVAASSSSHQRDSQQQQPPPTPRQWHQHRHQSQAGFDNFIAKTSNKIKTNGQAPLHPWEGREFHALGHRSAAGIFLRHVAVALRVARLFAGQSKPIVFSDSSAARGFFTDAWAVDVRNMFRYASCCQKRQSQMGSVEAGCIGASLNTVTKYLDKQRRAALLPMMPLTQFGG